MAGTDADITLGAERKYSIFKPAVPRAEPRSPGHHSYTDRHHLPNPGMRTQW